MKLFGGLSTGVGRARMGISRRGTPWAGVRGGKGPAYVGALASPPPRGRTKHAVPAVSHLDFSVADDGTIRLGDAVVDRAGLERVIQASKDAEANHPPKEEAWQPDQDQT